MRASRPGHAWGELLETMALPKFRPFPHDASDPQVVRPFTVRRLRLRKDIWEAEMRVDMVWSVVYHLDASKSSGRKLCYACRSSVQSHLFRPANQHTLQILHVQAQLLYIIELREKLTKK